MQKSILATICCLALFLSPIFLRAESSDQERLSGVEQPVIEKPNRPVDMLSSLVELEKNLKEQIQLSQKKLKASTSEAERAALEKEISQLDKQSCTTGKAGGLIVSEPLKAVENQEPPKGDY